MVVSLKNPGQAGFDLNSALVILKGIANVTDLVHKVMGIKKKRKWRAFCDSKNFFFFP